MTILLGITRAGKRFRYAERKKCIVARLLRHKKARIPPIPIGSELEFQCQLNQPGRLRGQNLIKRRRANIAIRQPEFVWFRKLKNSARN